MRNKMMIQIAFQDARGRWEDKVLKYLEKYKTSKTILASEVGLLMQR